MVPLQAQDLEPRLLSPTPTGGNFVIASYDAVVDGVDTSATRNGFGDPLFRLSMVLVGTGAWNPEDFITQPPKKFNLGAALRKSAPLGQYDPTKLINLGANR